MDSRTLIIQDVETVKDVYIEVVKREGFRNFSLFKINPFRKVKENDLVCSNEKLLIGFLLPKSARNTGQGSWLAWHAPSSRYCKKCTPARSLNLSSRYLVNIVENR